jgi:hypothetical protein
MNISNWKIGALAATLVIAATTVYAQTAAHTLKANIPFTFQAGEHQMLQPGEYYINRDGQTWFFTNAETRQKALVMSLYNTQGELRDHASLVFGCNANATHCSLRSINPPSGDPGGYWAPPKIGKAGASQNASIVVIPATVAR